MRDGLCVDKELAEPATSTYNVSAAPSANCIWQFLKLDHAPSPIFVTPFGRAFVVFACISAEALGEVTSIISPFAMESDAASSSLMGTKEGETGNGERFAVYSPTHAHSALVLPSKAGNW